MVITTQVSVRVPLSARHDSSTPTVSLDIFWPNGPQLLMSPLKGTWELKCASLNGTLPHPKGGVSDWYHAR